MTGRSCVLRRAWHALVLAVVVLVAAGCAVIPTSGPVGKSDPQDFRANPVNINFQQLAPTDGASPQEIIEGFIAAGTGVSDDYQVARQYLAPSVAGSWKPNSRTLVYQDAFSVEPGDGAANFKVTFSLQSVVDAAGIATPAAHGAQETLGFSVIKVDGQWRISAVPDGTMLKAADFSTLYSPYSLYFYDPTFSYGVPDVRWLAGRGSTVATAIVRAMLDGPSPYLKGAVASAFPDGIKLARDSVPVNDGVAQVDLTAQPLLDASVKSRQQMRAQLLATLQRGLNTVTTVTLRADSREVDLGNIADEAPALLTDNPVPSTQVAVSKGELVTIDGSRPTRVPQLPSVAKFSPETPAMSYDKANFAFRSASGNQVYAVAPGKPAFVAAAAGNLTAPSFAPSGWAWTAAGDGSGTVIAFDPRSGTAQIPTVVLNVPWLAGRTVTTLRVSRDGTRALVISSSGGASSVQIAGILKTGNAPKELSMPITLPGTGDPTLGVWVNETSVAVMRPSVKDPVSIEVLDLKHESVQLSPLEGLQWVSAGTGVRDIHAQTANEVYARVGNAWGIQVKDVSDASFAG